MQKYPLPKRSGNDLIDICGTRYHRISIINNAECLFIGIVSTPLTAKELQKFIENRIGYSTCTVFLSEVPESEVKDNKYSPSVMGLSTFESMLTQFVPEKVIREDTIKFTLTNKGLKVESVGINPETGEIIKKEVGE